MKYYSFCQFDSEREWVDTMSEEDVRKEYYPHWYQAMCQKFGKEYVDANYTFEDCLQEWVVCIMAWEVIE